MFWPIYILSINATGATDSQQQTPNYQQESFYRFEFHYFKDQSLLNTGGFSLHQGKTQEIAG
jgi:hypothetical protein